MPLVVTDGNHWTHAWLSLYIAVYLEASGIPRLCTRWQMDLTSLTHSSVARISASRELRAMRSWRIEHHDMPPLTDREQNQRESGT